MPGMQLPSQLPGAEPGWARLCTPQMPAPAGKPSPELACLSPRV